LSAIDYAIGHDYAIIDIIDITPRHYLILLAYYYYYIDIDYFRHIDYFITDIDCFDYAIVDLADYAITID
jgi:hypothetical protein